MLQDLFNLALKVLLVLIMPLVIFVYSEGDTYSGPLEIVISNFLYHPLWPFYGTSVYPYPSLWAWVGLLPTLLPGVWFAWSVPRRPLVRKVWKSAVVCTALTVVMNVLVVSVMTALMYPPGPILLPEIYWDVYVLGMMLTPSIAVLILLPLMMREMRILSVPRDLRLSNAHVIDDLPSDHLGRNRILAVLLWMSFVLMPLILGLSVNLASGLISCVLDGLFYTFEYVSFTPPIEPSYSYFLFGMLTVPYTQFLLMLLLSSVRLVFLRNVFGYLRGAVTGKRLLRVGLVGEVLPALVVALPTLLGGLIGLIQTPIPFPGALVAGYFFTRFFRVSKEIEGFKAESVEIVSGPDDIEASEIPETIKVPVIYVLRSRLSSLLRRRQD
jgi:hypothetical protein